MIRIIVGEIEFTILVRKAIFVYLMMVLIHSCTQPQEHSQPLIFLCVLQTFLWRLILWLNQIHTVVIIFLLFPDALPRWNLNRADWVQFDYLCKEKLTLDTIELYAEPIVLFTAVLCIIAKSCMPKTTAKQKKRCKPWFNTECKDAMKARKSAIASFKTNITSENLSNFRIARAKARRACCENVPAGSNMCLGLTVEQPLSQLGIWFVE